MIGGALCLPILFPSLFPSIDHETALILVRFGALLEVGWEITDALTRIYERVLLPNGEELQPNVLLVLIACHHSLSTLLVIPASIIYCDYKGPLADNTFD